MHCTDFGVHMDWVGLEVDSVDLDLDLDCVVCCTQTAVMMAYCFTGMWDCWVVFRRDLFSD